MNVIEETIDATLEPDGQLRLTHQPRLRPGPVQVTIRVAAGVGPQRGLADVIQEIAAEQRSRGFPGRSAEDLRAEDDERLADDDARDRELEAAPRGLLRPDYADSLFSIDSEGRVIAHQKFGGSDAIELLRRVKAAQSDGFKRAIPRVHHRKWGSNGSGTGSSISST